MSQGYSLVSYKKENDGQKDCNSKVVMHGMILQKKIVEPPKKIFYIHEAAMQQTSEITRN